MIVLQLLRDPEWVDLPGGMRAKLRRLTSPELREAKARALLAIKSLETSFDALKVYGLDKVDANGVRINLGSENQMMRVGLLISSVETAIDAIIEWEGVSLTKDGPPPPVDRDVLAMLLLDDEIDDKLRREITRLSHVVAREGKA